MLYNVVCVASLLITPILGAYEIAPLAYDKWALEPVIGMDTVTLHHDKHYAGYIRNLNVAFSQDSSQALETIQRGLVTESSAKRNNGGGAYNHGLYFSTIGPKAASLESDIGAALLAKINSAFTSVADMKTQFINQGKSVFGSGWVWVAVNPQGNLEIVTTPNQDNPLMNTVLPNIMQPLFGADVWEHAYYLDWQSDRGGHLAAFFEILNWKQVTTLYDTYGVNKTPVPASAFTVAKIDAGFTTTPTPVCQTSATAESAGLSFAAILTATVIAHLVR